MVAHHGGAGGGNGRLTVVTHHSRGQLCRGQLLHGRGRDGLELSDHDRGSARGRERAHSARSAAARLGQSFGGIESDGGQRREREAGEHAGARLHGPSPWSLWKSVNRSSMIGDYRGRASPDVMTVTWMTNL